jgi:hypothetical protein
LFTAITESGLNPSDFTWSKVIPTEIGADYVASQLKYMPTGAYFTFAGGDGAAWSAWWPPDENMDSFGRDHTWVDQRTRAWNWLIAVKRDALAPDLWGAIAAENILTEATAGEGNNDSFSDIELREIDQKLDEILRYIEANHPPDSSRQDFAVKRIGYLKAAARRLGKIDWLNLVVAQLVAIVVKGVIPSSAVPELMHFAGSVLHNVITSARPLLG